MSNPHRAAGIRRAGADRSRAAAVVVAVHGRNQTPDYLLEHLVAKMGVDGPSDVAWLLPTAAGNSWYPEGFRSPIEANQPLLDQALEVLADLEGEVADHDPLTVVWLGFSQGACLVSEHLGRRPRRWGGLVAFTGARVAPEGTDVSITGSFDGMPAYFSVAEADDWVPEPYVHETAAAFRAAGADVRVEVFAGGDHCIRDAEVEGARVIIDAARRRGRADRR